MSLDDYDWKQIEEEEKGWCSDGTAKVFLVVFVAFLSLGVGIVLGITIDEKIISDHSSLCKVPLFPSYPSNLILIIADGLGPSSATLARILKKAPLSMDTYNTGTVRTYSANSYLTDSGAAATAMATGVKTYNDGIAIFPGNNSAVGTIMEAAKANGATTAFVTTGKVVGASTAAFTSHTQDRDWATFIAGQQVYNQSVDLMFGGGSRYFDNATLEHARQKGYNVIFDKNAMNEVVLPTLGLFSTSAMAYEIERPYVVGEPSLLEMTTKALDLVVQKGNPFFLLVESDNIDSANHEWDGGSLSRELLMFDSMVAYVLDFAEKNKDTLVVITSDHECGGIGLGRDFATNIQPEFLLQQKRSARFIAQEMHLSLNNKTWVNETMNAYTGIIPTSEEIDDLIEAGSKGEDELTVEINTIVSSRVSMGWTTFEHTGVDVNLWAYGPGVHSFCGNMDNTDIGWRIMDLFGWYTWPITESLVNFPTKPPAEEADLPAGPAIVNCSSC